jgi:hypothetical protein
VALLRRKVRIADIVWARLGDVDNFIEPFCGSAAVLLRRPHPPRIETINDADCMVANFWRATQHDPERVAEFADGPVNEADLHARHKWLVLSDEAKTFRKRMRSEPDYYDPKMAGWWCWGLCCWIGGGWCDRTAIQQALPRCQMRRGESAPGEKVATASALSPNRKPRIDGGANQAGHGIHAKGMQLPMLTGDSGGGRIGALGVHSHQAGGRAAAQLESDTRLVESTRTQGPARVSVPQPAAPSSPTPTTSAAASAPTATSAPAPPAGRGWSSGSADSATACGWSASAAATGCGCATARASRRGWA